MTLAAARDELEAHLRGLFPQHDHLFSVDEVTAERTTVSMVVDGSMLGPSGRATGPALFGLADLAFYAATVAHVGLDVAAMTSNASVSFLRAAPPGRLVAHARVLKVGRTSTVGDVIIRPDGDDAPIAHASMTFAILSPTER